MKKPKRRLGYEYLLACIAIKVGFFALIWIDYSFVELPGYRIPDGPGDVIRFLGAFGDQQEADTKAWALWSLYLIPLGTTLGMAGEIFWWARGKDSRWIRAIAPLCFVGALATIAIFFLGVQTWVLDFLGFLAEDEEPFKLSDIPWEAFAPGIYVTFAAFVLSIPTVFTVRKPSKKKGLAYLLGR